MPAAHPDQGFLSPPLRWRGITDDPSVALWQPGGPTGRIAKVGPPITARSIGRGQFGLSPTRRSRLSRSGCWVSRVFSACQRARSPNQKALSLALRAPMARRRHSSARRRKCSTFTCFLPINRPTSLVRVENSTPGSSLVEAHRVNSLRGFTRGDCRQSTSARSGHDFAVWRSSIAWLAP
jgi:hypothetical protein